jgi:hypothetical protein
MSRLRLFHFKLLRPKKDAAPGLCMRAEAHRVPACPGEAKKTISFSNCFPAITIELSHADTSTADLSDILNAYAVMNFNAVMNFSIRFAC